MGEGMEPDMDEGNLFWRAFRSSNLAMTVTRLDDGTYLAVNPAFEATTGFSHEEVTGRTSVEVGLWTAPGDRDAMMSELQEAGSLSRPGYPLRIKSGAIRLFDVWLTLIDLAGVPHVLGVLADVTETREARNLLETVVEHAPIVVFALDADGVFTLSEGSALEKLGLRPGEVVGKSAWELYAQDAEIVAQIRRALSGEEFRAVATPGDLAFDVYWAPIRDGAGNVVGVSGVATDVTERERAQAARARLWAHLVRSQEAERAHIAGELHDGPIQQIAALQLRLAALHDLLPDSPVPAQLEKTVEEGLAALRKMVTQLRPSTLDRLGLAAAIDAELRAMSAELGMTAEIEDADLVQEPNADIAITAYRMVQEALSNVREHAHASSVHVRLSTHEQGLLIRVKDDGVGFEPSPGEAGHIGLPLLKEQAELVGGWVRVLSTPGSGTTVEIWLPSAVEPELA